MLNLIKYTISCLIVIGGFTYYLYNASINSPKDISGENIEFSINKGDSTNIIAKNLAGKNIINSEFYFKIYAWKNNISRDFKAGNYLLNTNKNIIEITKILSEGDNYGEEITIKVIEGWTNHDITNYLDTIKFKKSIDKESLINTKIKNQPKKIKQSPILKDAPLDANLEGYLFPDTYRVFVDAQEEEIILKMINNLEKKITEEMLIDIKNQGKSIHTIITMASLIEKEVNNKKDMKTVSGIFWNRLNNNIKLQSDATLSYFFKDNLSAHSLKDLETNTPYNSYKYKGLPPTPISNPGIEAIKSAIYPEKTSFLFFLTGKDGITYFANTYKEHLKNKTNYLD